MPVYPRPPLAIDLAQLAPHVVELIRTLVAALDKDSPGGGKITPAEWLAIGEDAGVVVADVLAGAAKVKRGGGA